MIDTAYRKPSRVKKQKRRDKRLWKSRNYEGGRYNDERYYKTVKRSRRKVKQIEHDLLPKKEGMRRWVLDPGWAYPHRNRNAIARLLRSSVGRPWEEVHSDLVHKFFRRVFSPRFRFDFVRLRAEGNKIYRLPVEGYTFIDLGEVCILRKYHGVVPLSSLRIESLYVDPVSGILKVTRLPVQYEIPWNQVYWIWEDILSREIGKNWEKHKERLLMILKHRLGAGFEDKQVWKRIRWHCLALEGRMIAKDEQGKLIQVMKNRRFERAMARVELL